MIATCETNLNGNTLVPSLYSTGLRTFYNVEQKVISAYDFVGFSSDERFLKLSSWVYINKNNIDYIKNEQIYFKDSTFIDYHYLVENIKKTFIRNYNLNAILNGI